METIRRLYVYGRGEDTTISRKKWSNRKGRRRKMKRSTKKVQIGYQGEESNRKKFRRKKGNNEKIV